MNNCRYCEKEFKSEKTLANHMCVKKRRHMDKDTIGSRLGFSVFQRFFELTTKSKKKKTFEEFVNSDYYIAFVKFGRHLVDLNPIDSNDFIDYLIKNSVRLSDWRKDDVYSAYLRVHMEKEPVERAIERTIIEIGNWGKNHNKEIKDFFNEVNIIEAVFLIKSGRISPWVLYLADTSGGLINSLTPEQHKIIKEVIDPKKWHEVFMKNKQDVIFVKGILKEAGL